MNHTMSQEVQVWEQAFCVVGTKQVCELFFVHAAELPALDVVVPSHFHVPEFEFIAGPLQPLLYVPLRPSLGICGEINKYTNHRFELPVIDIFLIWEQPFMCNK